MDPLYTSRTTIGVIMHVAYMHVYTLKYLCVWRDFTQNLSLVNKKTLKYLKKTLDTVSELGYNTLVFKMREVNYEL